MTYEEKFPGEVVPTTIPEDGEKDSVTAAYERDMADLAFTLEPLEDVVRTLREPGGCDWDRAQTHKSLRRYLLEEVYEALDAIDADDMDNLREELGDILLQVVFHARLAEERGEFTVQDVINDVSQKMVGRHPHVFNQSSALEMGETKLTWDQLKAKEKGHGRKKVLAGVPKGLPALMRAQKLQEKAAKVGFDWDSVDPCWAKVYEEIEEFKEAIAQNDRENMEKEGGDVLFALINLFRWFKISGENALNRTNTKFCKRFAYVEQCVDQSGRPWESYSLAELDAFWEQAKAHESI